MAQEALGWPGAEEAHPFGYIRIESQSSRQCYAQLAYILDKEEVFTEASASQGYLVLEAGSLLEGLAATQSPHAAEEAKESAAISSQG